MYSAIEHLSLSIFLKEYDLMAMLTVYIDDSGTHKQSPVAVAAGFLSDVRRWGPTCLEKDWRVALAATNNPKIIEKGFHMAAFQAREGIFKRLTEEQRQNLENSLFQAINDHADVGFSAAVMKEDYDRLVVGKLRDKLGGHHQFVVAVCLWMISTYRFPNGVESGIVEPLEYVIAKGTRHNGDVCKLFHNLRKWPVVARGCGINEDPIWRFAKHSYPLQAADILAWYSSQHLREFDPTRPFCPHLKPVRGSKFSRFYNKSALANFVPEITEKYVARGWKAPMGGFV
jgi:hypothetical protein